MAPVFTKALETIVRVLAQVLLVPFFKSLGEWLSTKYQTWKHRKKSDQEIKDKVEDYAQSNNRDSARDTFSKLP